MSAEELLPCPFCGGEGEMSYYSTMKSPAPAGYFIECTTCEASGEKCEIHGEMPDRVEYTKARAIAAWNLRTPPAMSADHIPDAGPAVTDVGKLIQAPLVGRLVEALKRISAMTPGAANAVDARALHLTVKAIADEALDHIPDAGNMVAPAEAVAYAWASEWTGIGGLARALHTTEQEAVDNAEWMNGRVFSLYAHPAPIKPSGDTGELRVLARGTWAGDNDVLRVGWPVEVLASDPRPAEVIKGHTLPRLLGRTACWVRCIPEGRETPMYRSCDLCDIDLSDEDFDRLSDLIQSERAG